MPWTGPLSFEFAQMVLTPILIFGVGYIARYIFILRSERRKLTVWEECSAKVIEVRYAEREIDDVPIMPIKYEYEYNGKKYLGTKATVIDLTRSDDKPAYYFPDIYNYLIEAKKIMV